MLYYLVRPLARLLLSVWYRKIYLVQKENVPLDAPVIFAINHPTIFIEPCLMACFQPRDLYFLAKSVIFIRPFKKVLGSLHILPVYRMKDIGYGTLKKNYAIFEFCHQVLAQNKAVLIMPEGTSIQTRRLRPLKKGMARMAFGSYQKNKQENLQIIPVSVYFTDADAIRSEVTLAFGLPVFVKDHYPAFQNNENQGIAQLTQSVAEGLKANMVHIDDEADDELAEHLLRLARNQKNASIFPFVKAQEQPLRKAQQVVTAVNRMSDLKKTTLQEKVRQYVENLTHYNVTDFGMRHKSWFSIGQLMVVVMGFVPFVLGVVGNILPYGLAKAVGTKADDVETRMSAVLLSFLVIYLPYLFFVAVIGWFAVGWIGMGIALLLPSLGYFALLYQERLGYFSAAYRAKGLPSDVWAKLHVLRKEIRNLVVDP